MGENPEPLPGPDRPVEQVSWNDVQVFLSRVAELVPGLRLRFQPRHTGNMRAGPDRRQRGTETLDRDRLVLREQRRRDPSGGREGAQRLGPARHAGQRVGVVCGRVPAVWRRGEGEASAGRVLRGGSWHGDARDVRAACRGRGVPGHRDDDIGFRCAEFRSPGPASRVERAASRSERGAEPRGDDETASGTRWLDLAGRDEDQAAFPAIVPVRIVSDLDQLTLRTVTPPRLGAATSAATDTACGRNSASGTRSASASAGSPPAGS